jgi:hypothetical protein
MPEARQSIARTRGVPLDEAATHPVVQREAEEIKANYEKEVRLKAGWIDCFKIENKTLYRTLLGQCWLSYQHTVS